MPFKKNVHYSSKTNHKKKSLSGAEEYNSASQTSKDASAKASESAESLINENQNIQFTKGMKEREVKINLFLLEGTIKFETLTLREKMTVLIKHASQELKGWFFDKKVEGKLAESWDAFKDEVLSYCLEEDLSCIKKIKEERWSAYIKRLQQTAEIKEIQPEEIIRKLRKTPVPRDLQILFLTTNNDLMELINRVEEWENIFEMKSAHRNRNTNSRYNNKGRSDETNVKCFKCSKRGHYANQCKNKDISMNIYEETEGKGIRKDKIKVNDSEYLAVFDSGSSVNLMSYKFCYSVFKRMPEKLLSPKNIYLLNGTKVILTEKINLQINYKGNIIKDNFYLIKNCITNIIIGNPLIEHLKNNPTKFPVTCPIYTKGNEIISWSRPIRDLEKRRAFQKLVEEYESKSIVEVSNSLWCNPVVVVKKKSGEFRFTLDLTKLNDRVELDCFPIPRIQEILHSLNGKKIFSIIDLEDGFFQVPLEENHRQKTAFLDAKNRLMHFTRMPQGFKNSPALFQRGMYKILEGLLGTACFSYIDDILIFGETQEDHDKNYSKVIERLKNFNIKINKRKSVFSKSEVQFLGFLVSQNKIKPLLNRAEGIKNFPKPSSKRFVRKFLGMVNYDRSFIDKLSIIAIPLYKLLENKKWEWNNDCDMAFSNIKKAFESEMELLTPNLSKRFILETDASNLGLGAVLKQDGKAIAFISRVLKKHEKNYTITEKEFLAALWAMEKFKHLLIGNEFTLITDHKALEIINSKIEFGTPRTTRWMERIREFTFVVEYRPGGDMGMADTLSRNVSENIETSLLSTNIVKAVLETHRKNNHRKDIKEKLEKENINLKTKEISTILESCEQCSKFDKKTGRNIKHVITNRPGDIVACDLLELSRGRLILNCIDYFTRKIFACVIKKKEPYNIIKMLSDIYVKLPFKKLHTDNGKEFCNSEVKLWCENNNVEHVFTIPYYHPSNGRIERANRTLRSILRKTNERLKTILPHVVDVYNSSKHRGIGMSPDDALKEENWPRVCENQFKYAQEFKNKRFNYSKSMFDEGSDVLVRNEIKRTKMDPEFHDKGKIYKKISNMCYEVIMNDGRHIKRHASQLKLDPGDVGYEKSKDGVIGGHLQQARPIRSKGVIIDSDDGN